MGNADVKTRLGIARQFANIANIAVNLLHYHRSRRLRPRYLAFYAETSLAIMVGRAQSARSDKALKSDSRDFLNSRRASDDVTKSGGFAIPSCCNSLTPHIAMIDGRLPVATSSDRRGRRRRRRKKRRRRRRCTSRIITASGARRTTCDAPFWSKMTSSTTVPCPI